MANSNTPFGLSPVAYLNGSRWNGQAREYYIASNDGNAFAIGDPVKSSGDGDTNGVAGVTLATGGHAPNPIRGVIVGMGGTIYGGPGGDPASPQTIIIPATKTKAYYVLVVDDPNVIFEVQEDSDAANLAATDIGSNVDLVAGANNGYVSGWMLNSNVVNTGADYQVRLLGLSQRQGNAIGTYAKWLVLINQHELRVGQIGV